MERQATAADYSNGRDYDLEGFAAASSEGRGAGRSRHLNHPGAFASAAMSGQGQGQQGGGLRSRSANEANGGGCGYDAGGGIGDHDHDGGGRLKDGRRKDPEPDTANFRLDDYRWHGGGGRRKRGLGIGLGLGPELSGGGAIGGIGVVGHPGWNEREARMEPPAPPGGGGGNLRPVPTSRPGAMDGLGRGGGGSGGVGEFPHGEDGDGGGGGGGGGGNRHHAVAGRAGGAGAGAPAGRWSGEQPARVQEYKDEVVDKWKALSVAAFDVLDTVRAASSNDNEDRDFLKAIVREAARRGVLDGTPYIASLADLLRGEDEVQEQQQPADDLGGVGNGAAAAAAAPVEAGPAEADAKPHCPLCDALIAKHRVSLHLEGFNSNSGKGEVFASHIHNFLDRHSDARVDDLPWEAEANLKHLLIACDKLVQRSESGDIEEPASKHVTMVVKWTEDKGNENRFDVVEFIDKFVVDPNKSLYKDIIFGELNTSSREAAQHHLDAISSRRPAAATQAAAAAATAASTHGSDNNSEMISCDQMTFRSGFSKQHRPY